MTELSLHGLRGKDVGHGRAVALAIAVLAAIGLLTAVPASTQATAGDPALVGQWSSPQSWPIVAVHMSLLPTGQVIALDGFAAGPNSEHLWDPVSGAFTPVPYGRNLFCAGHIQLADGRTLFVGGHVSANSGLADTTIYNPTNKTWFRGPDMTVGRWYPTATQLPDGRVFTLSGDNIVQDRPGTDPPFSDASVDSLPEVYDPKTNTWTDLPQGRLTTPLYPFLFVLSDGRILDAGPDKTTRVMTPGAWTWSTIGSSSFDAHSAVMYRPDKIMKSGSWADPDFKGSLTYQSGAKTAVLDMAAASPAWRDTAPMAHARSYHNLTLLPDGTVLASGGGSNSDGVDITKSVLPAEIWNPDTETWTEVAGLQNGRLYHSTALLLPDGRVLMAGGGQLPNSGAVDQKNAEIYSPPYLFKGTRPVLTSVPSTMNYGSNFTVNTPDAARIAKVSLIRSPSVTHAFDENQRFQWLTFTKGTGSLTVSAPANANLAPPGDYMLFVVDDQGVPSIASFVRASSSADTTAPAVSLTAPAAGATVSNTVTVSADATDAGTVAGVQFKLDGANLGGEDTTAPYSYAWDTKTATNGSHSITAVARDLAGNSATSGAVAVTVSNTGPSPSLVAAYSFDEGSGTTLTDVTGKGHTGTLNGAAWSPSGKFGGALSFDGVNDWVTVADANDLDLTTGMTLEAWVRPAALSNVWRTVVFKETPSYYAYALYANTGSTRPSANAVIAGTDRDIRGTAAVGLNTWAHLAATYDGATLRLFVDGAQVSQVAAPGAMTTSTGVLRIGGNNVWPEWFQGLIDELRIYNRALTATEIQADMNASVGVPDTTPPSTPTGLAVTATTATTIATSWTASTDAVGVARYDLYRDGISVGTSPTNSFTFTSIPCGTSSLLGVEAVDAAGNRSGRATLVATTAACDATPPTVALTAPGAGSTVSGAVNVTATAGDNDAVAGVQFKLDGVNLGSEDTAAPYSVSWTTTTASNGGHTLTAVARDASNNSTTSAPVAVTVSNTVVPGPTGLVAAWAFDETAGTSAADASGKGHTGTLSGPAWVPGGKFGGALSFDGVNDWVTVADAADLRLSAGMTLEAWVQPSGTSSGWKTVAFKENASYYSYALYSHTGSGVPSANGVIAGTDRDVRGGAAAPSGAWTHLAATFDGTALRLFVNGTQASQILATGSLSSSTGPFRIGGNAVWPEWFTGLIDEVRVYDRALSAAEIQTDMARSVGTPDTTAPSAPTAFAKTGSTATSIATSWTAATDNVGVASYTLFRDGVSVGTTTGTTFTFGTLACGTSYLLGVQAVDGAGNTSTRTTLTATTSACDTTAPSAPGTLTATPGTGSVALAWGAATDNSGTIARYNVHRGTTAGFVPAVANRIAQPTATSYTDGGLTPGTYYYKVTAEDPSANVGAPSNEASATIASADTSPPTVSVTAPSAGATVSGAVTVTATAADNVSVAGVQFKLDGANLGAEDTSAPYSVSWTTTSSANGAHTLTAVARDGAANSTTSAGVGVTVANTAPPATGLVGAWAFDDGSGTSAADATGNGNIGTLNGPAWTTGGKFGGALTFDGVNDWVTVADANALDFTTAMTLEAWVRPTATSGWRTAVFKEGTGYYTYALYAETGSGVPSANAVTAGSDRDARATAAVPVNTWTHVAATYDGTAVRIFVNGVQSGTVAATGAITTSTGPLRVGGNNIWPEWFEGQIDEVRVYNRALAAAEIQSDMTRSIGTPDTSPPTSPAGLTASGGLGQISLTWPAASDNVGVVRYNVHRGTTTGFAPTAANRVAQPTGASYVDAGLAAGTYYYRVTAEDAAGNVGGPSPEATATATADTTAPTVSVTAPAAGATVANTLSVTANAADNVSVAGVQFKLDGANLGAEDTTAPYSVAWDTTATANGSHTLTAVARDPSGNSTTSAAVSVTVSNSGTPPPTGLVAGYGFDAGSGTAVADSGTLGNNGTAAGPTWTIGRFGTALQFDGTNDWVTVPDSSSLDITRMTLEAWVYPTTSNAAWRTIAFKEQSGDLVYGMYAQTSTNQPSGHAYVGGTDRVARGGTALPANQWSHLATTYDGSAVRLYVNASLVATTTIAGSLATSTGVFRIGGNNVWPEFFAGRIDEVRVYNKALTAAEIQSDMTRAVATDAMAPTVTAISPTDGTIDLPVSTVATATFNEAMDPASLTSASFEVKDPAGVAVPATVSYDPITATATLTPSGALVYGTRYTVVVHGGAAGARARDAAGNALATDRTWSFTTEGAPPPILVVGSTANKFSTYTAELLRAEGMNAFAMLDVALLTPGLLSFYDVVVLGDVALTPLQVTVLTDWVTAGGNLIALSPDKQLAGLLGLTDAASTLSNTYLKVDGATQAGTGITTATMQFHGSADRYTLAGATALATLYSNATTATTNPAVSLRAVGSSGGQAAAFAFDLARSVALTRQGNPAWAGQERDGVVPIRPDDLFYGARSGDVQPDWLDTSKIAIPQADEQQRLLVNMIVTMSADRKPLPRFWYLPRGEKAVVVMTGDDHAVGGTAGRFDRYKALSPAGCNVAAWECVRGTSYLYPASQLTNAQAAAYEAEGFEVSFHPQTGTPCANWTPASLRNDYTTQLNQFRNKYTSVPSPVTNRTHCVAWSDWLTMAKVELENGSRLDLNYYHYPGPWIGAKPGFMTGAGFPMRFVDTDGTMIQEYMAHTFMTDESGQSFPSTIDALLDGAVGPNGYYGAFTANMHTDLVDSPGSDAIIASAKARSVPVITARQLLTWTDGRDASTLRTFAWDGTALTFNVSAAAGSTGLELLVPRVSGGKTVSAVTRGAAAVPFTVTTIKGIEYAIVPAATGSYRVSYS